MEENVANRVERGLWVEYHVDHHCGPSFDVGIDEVHEHDVVAVVEDDGDVEELLLLLHHGDHDEVGRAMTAHEGQSCFFDEPAFVMVVKSIRWQQH